MPTTNPRPFPKRLIKKGEADATVVKAVQAELKKRGYGPFTAGVFDAQMVAVVKLFQAQNVDSQGNALVVDGEIGRFTWGALFGVPAATASPTPPSPLMLQALGMAASQIGQMEAPLGSNRGPMVDLYLKETGVPLTGSPDTRAWCMAFVYWAFEHAALNLGTTNVAPRTAGCLDHWGRARFVPGAVRITSAEALADLSLVKPGQVFICDFGHGLGHAGIVERVLPDGRLVTVEGNTNNDGSRSGVGVFRLERRKLSDKLLKGLVDYSAC
ncbi:CHAP domain-containing protein [Pseudorhodoferax sp. LjRoot39]|uniref:CHAP domain-containing protein n=1 Tax=Pseudorhodoferax sp. LjRoot39 TaxID=3342328 RepID=UPI003ECDD9AE